jgi:cell division septation protein DedD
MAADDKRPGIYGVEPQRSIFSSLWFRVVLVVLVVGAVGALAVPRVLDFVSPPPPPKAAPLANPAPPAPPTPTPALVPESVERPTANPGLSTPAPAPAAAPLVTEEKPAEAKAAKPSKPAARRVAKASAASTATRSGAYWIQVGAFKDADAARRLAARLREQHYSVVESSTGASGRGAAASAPSPSPSSEGAGSDKYDVFVAGGASADLSTKLSAKGLSTEPARDGVVVRPSLPLRDAVALSKDLAAQGLQVQVRRSGSPPRTAAAPAPAASAGGDAMHRVRVGPYADRAAATSALKELEGKGYKPFIARR